MRKAEFLGFARVKGKDMIVFKQHDVTKVTDGFHDRDIAEEEYKKLRMNDTRTRPDKLIKRLRGTRPWHPVLKAIDNASNKELI